jgi:uncharacterized protein
LNCLYIASLNPRAGKTLLAAGLAKFWQNSGRRIGYLRLNSAGQAAGAAPNAVFLRSLLAIPENPAGSAADQLQPLSEAYPQAALDKDLVICEGLLPEVVKALKTLPGRLLVVHDYADSLPPALPAYKRLNNLSGVIFNKVPRRNLKMHTANLQSHFAQNALPLLGIIPEDRCLMTLSVADLAVAVHGQILNNAEKGEDLIENLMLGVSSFDRGPAYYSRKTNKAVLVWGQRPGFRPAAVAGYPQFALQTSTRCIVISGGVQPLPAVAQKAAEAQVPLISVPGSLPEIVAAVEKALQELPFQQPAKLPLLLEILPRVLDLKPLSELLFH